MTNLTNNENNKILVDFNTTNVDGKVKCIPSVTINDIEQLINPPQFDTVAQAKGFAQIQADRIKEQLQSLVKTSNSTLH
jgi:hypothetical protein